MSKILGTAADLAYRGVKPALFRMGGGDAEVAHEWTVRRLATVSRSRALRSVTGSALRPAGSPVRVWDVEFPNALGLAAGMDKDGRALHAWPALGFGFVEVGTVTWHPQPGNPKPRLFRLPESGALINRMGFNNAGARALSVRLEQVGPIGVPLGISIGKSKITALRDAVDDYVASLLALRGFADYIAVNVSSPNTPGLRSLQDKGFLTELTSALVAEADGVPVLVKVAPDLTTEAVDELLEVCARQSVAGIIATNTTIERDGLDPSDRRVAKETGGLSGRPLTQRAVEMVAHIHKTTDGKLPIIGVGGISGADDAHRMLDAGASLVQIYSGLIFQGPGLVRSVVTGISERGE